MRIKKHLPALLATCFSLSLVGCGSDDPNSIVVNQDVDENVTPDKPDDNIDTSLILAKALSDKRDACDFGALSLSASLESVSDNHANYIKHVYQNTDLKSFDESSEAVISGYEQHTGAANPFYQGDTLADRVAKQNAITSNKHSVYEFVATKQNRGAVEPHELLNSLLSSPYQIRSLLSTDISSVAAQYLSYEPTDTLGATPALSTLVVTVGDGSNPDYKANKFTPSVYPCSQTTNVSPVLAPNGLNPFGDKSAPNYRDLSVNPVGQPVYIRQNSDLHMKVSNVKYTDVDANIDVPVFVLDATNDAYPDTEFALGANEAFIIPLTDSLDSCKGSVGNCGLKENTKYKVTYDVQIGHSLKAYETSFTTGSSYLQNL